MYTVPNKIMIKAGAKLTFRDDYFCIRTLITH